MPKLVDRTRYRQELLTQCFELFAEQGYAAVTMRQLAQALGISTGTLYHYFPSKQELFEQMVQAMEERDLAAATLVITPQHSLPQRIELAFEFVRQNEDYFFRQLLMYIDFYQYQNRAVLVNESQSCTLRRVCDRMESNIRDLLGLEDSQMIQLMINVIDGLLCARIYGEVIDWNATGKLWSMMVTAYLEQCPCREESLQINPVKAACA